MNVVVISVDTRFLISFTLIFLKKRPFVLFLSICYQVAFRKSPIFYIEVQVYFALV